ncbi:MAG: tetratricopeptide repeat protein [Leptolyngbya sp. SIOISBB]|nr:tetratricopeptide repeat protein [Leptolyngbya sp. SIOISBB]
MGRAIAAPQTPLQLGLEAFEHQDYDSAIHHFEKAVKSGQALGDAYSYQCLTLLMLNKPQLATHSCQAALAVNSEHPQAHFYQGLAHYRLGQFEAAIAAFDQHLHAHSDDSRAYYNYGLAKFAQGDVAGAIAQYHQALIYAAALSPVEMSNLYNDLGIAYWSNDHLKEAKFALDQAVAMDASDMRAYFNRGCICHHLGEYHAALQNFDQVLTLDPRHAETYFNRGLVQQQMGDTDAARQDYQTASEQFRQQGDLTGAQKAKLRLQQLHKSPVAVG